MPEPLWWLMGAIVSFYFGARHQAKTHDLQRTLAATLSRTPEVAAHIEALGTLRDEQDDPEDGGTFVTADNAALADWERSRER